jgi:Ca-activated chloride channel family protein
MTGERVARALSELGIAPGIDAFEHGEWLPLLALLATFPLWLAFRRRAPALAWPTPQAPGTRLGRHGPEPQRIATGVLRTLCLLCLAVVLCGPVSQRRLAPEPGLGLDLILVLDTSESMGERDAWLDSNREAPGISRLRLARGVVARFAARRIGEGDRVGLVVFGGHAFTACPLTSDGGLLRAALERVEVGMAGDETALGDALALGVKRASAVEDSAQRVVVLLTDGRSNAGNVPVPIASELARARGIRVHTVGIGIDALDGSEASAAGEASPRFEKHAPDAQTLSEIASRTGGRFFAARSGLDLQAVYDAIDGIERTARPLPATIAVRPAPEPMLTAAFSLLVIEIGVGRLWRRRLP